jgi:NADPH-dependent 2,4-dienoyl-CoA reductase/sulfur reductase-like enzyme
VDVAVIGAGPAGIQAALTAAARGHRVRLLECDDRIGGMLALAAELPFKKPLIRLLEFYLAELRALGVELQRGRRADPADIDAGVVIEAVGARWPIADNFRNGERVVDAVTALRDPSALGARVAIVGAGTIGAEIAWHLATLGRRVTLIERRPGFGTDVNLISSLVLPAELARHGVDVRFGTTATGFGADGLAITNGSEADELAVDSVVLTVREGAPVTTMTAVVDQGNRHWIGECAGLRGLLEATRSGHRAALSIDELSSIAYGLS